jgi:hypothetical protein
MKTIALVLIGTLTGTAPSMPDKPDAATQVAIILALAGEMGRACPNVALDGEGVMGYLHAHVNNQAGLKEVKSHVPEWEQFIREEQKRDGVEAWCRENIASLRDMSPETQGMFAIKR